MLVACASLVVTSTSQSVNAWTRCRALVALVCESQQAHIPSAVSFSEQHVTQQLAALNTTQSAGKMACREVHKPASKHWKRVAQPGCKAAAHSKPHLAMCVSQLLVQRAVALLRSVQLRLQLLSSSLSCCQLDLGLPAGLLLLLLSLLRHLHHFLSC